MSDRYHYILDFGLRRDTPRAVIDALTARAQGQDPAASDLAELPEIVAGYLSVPDFTGGYEPQASTRIRAERSTHIADNPGWHLHYERLFHDDEYFNAGIYFIWWLFSLAAGQGHLAVKLTEYDTPPEIYTKVGDDVVITTLGYNPETHQALDYRTQPLAPDLPISISRSGRAPLAETLANLEVLNTNPP